MAESIKSSPETRHVIAHLIAAIEALIDGEKDLSQYEIDSISNLIFFEDEKEAAKEVRKMACRDKKKSKHRPKKKKK